MNAARLGTATLLRAAKKSMISGGGRDMEKRCESGCEQNKFVFEKLAVEPRQGVNFGGSLDHNAVAFPQTRLPEGFGSLCSQHHQHIAMQ